MKNVVLIGIVSALSASPAFAGKSGGVSTLDQAKAYTDAKVAAEATARGEADSAEGVIRENADKSLQDQIDDLNTAVGKARTYNVGAAAFVPYFGTVERNEICAWGTGSLVVAVPLPTGAVVNTVSAYVWDDDADNDAFLNLYILMPRIAYTVYAGGVKSNGIDLAKVTWSGSITVPADEFFRVLFDGQGSDKLKVCGLSVTYTEPSS